MHCLYDLWSSIRFVYVLSPGFQLSKFVGLPTCAGDVFDQLLGHLLKLIMESVIEIMIRKTIGNPHQKKHANRHLCSQSPEPTRPSRPKSRRGKTGHPTPTGVGSTVTSENVVGSSGSYYPQNSDDVCCGAPNALNANANAA